MLFKFERYKIAFKILGEEKSLLYLGEKWVKTHVDTSFSKGVERYLEVY